VEELTGKRVLVTGAADGIGRGAALAFAREGARLMLVDIDSEKVASVAEEVRRLGAECKSYTADVSDEGSVRVLAEEVRRDFGGVDVLVNVAGVCVVSRILEQSLEDWKWLLGVNLWGPLHTIREFVPAMCEQRSGHVVNVASLGGLVHFGLIGSYCVSKAGLVALSESLAQEVYKDGVRVTAFCPGLTATGIVERMRFTGYSRAKTLDLAAFLIKYLMSSERAGELIVKATRRETPLVVTTFMGRLTFALNRACPWLVRFTLRRANRPVDRRFR
jgi:NAD(P)-dependent dehydrogenase (short-subunit alcohol dehydrogenase family)